MKWLELVPIIGRAILLVIEYAQRGDIEGWVKIKLAAKKLCREFEGLDADIAAFIVATAWVAVRRYPDRAPAAFRHVLGALENFDLRDDIVSEQVEGMTLERIKAILGKVP